MNTCGKHPFTSKLDADRAADRVRRRDHGTPRAYRCKACKHFHVGNGTDRSKLAQHKARKNHLRDEQA